MKTRDNNKFFVSDPHKRTFKRCWTLCRAEHPPLVPKWQFVWSRFRCVQRMDPELTQTYFVKDFKATKWLPPEESPKIPTPRAGNMAIAVDGKLVVGGGESVWQRTAPQ